MKKFQNILLSFFSIVISFIVIEVYLHIDHYSPNYDRYRYVLNDVKLTFNDDPSIYFSDYKENKTIFLGDSFTVGEVCAHDKKDFVGLIKSKYEDSKNSFYNFGSLGISPSDMINIYNYIEQGDFNQLVIVLYYNDIFLSHQTCKNLISFEDFNILLLNCDSIYQKEFPFRGLLFVGSS